ncbi:MAG: hypothetical protein Q8K00_12315 [Syntrophales bacterium]|nr:hypothetical protein [Syntrophales bacterium]
MTTEAITFSRHIREQHIRYKTFSKPNSLRRFRYAIEHSDWDEEILIQEEWIEKMSIGVIIVASLFIASVLVMMFLS